MPSYKHSAQAAENGRRGSIEKERKGEREFEGGKEGWRGSGITSAVVLISASSWVKSLLFSSMSLIEHPPSHSRFSSSLGTSCTQERECSLCWDLSYITAVSPDLLGSIFLPRTMLPPALVCSVLSRVHVVQNHILDETTRNEAEGGGWLHTRLLTLCSASWQRCSRMITDSSRLAPSPFKVTNPCQKDEK